MRFVLIDVEGNEEETNLRPLTLCIIFKSVILIAPVGRGRQPDSGSTVEDEKCEPVQL